MVNRVGRALRDHRVVMAQPLIPRSIADEERAGYEAGRSLKSLPQDSKGQMIAAYEAEIAHPDPIKAARAKGLIRGLREETNSDATE